MLSIAEELLSRGVASIVTRTLQLVFIIAFGAVTYAQVPIQEADICEVIKNPSVFANKPIVIFGSLYAGPHGMYLYAKNCDSTPSVKSGSICVARSTFRDVPEVPFQTKSEALVLIGEAARAIREQHMNYEDALRVRGILFVAQKDAGFCHLGKSSAVIVVDQVLEYALTFPDQ